VPPCISSGAVRWLRSRDFHAVLAEPTAVAGHEIPDAIGWDGRGNSTLVECKTSRADFLHDAEKRIRSKKDEDQLGNERWFLTPRHLLTRDEIPAGWGLVEVTAAKAFIVTPAIRHKVKSQRLEMALMSCCLGRLQLDKFAEAFGIPEAYVEARHWAQIIVKDSEGLEVDGISEESELGMDWAGTSIFHRRHALASNIRSSVSGLGNDLHCAQAKLRDRPEIAELLAIAATLRTVKTKVAKIIRG